MVRAESCRTQGRTRKTAGGPAGTSGPRTRRTKGGDVNLFKRGEVWWYEFIFAGRRIRESAKTSRKTIAIQAERGRRLELEKTLAGLPVEKQENRINSVTGVVRKYLAHYEINHRAKSVLFAIGRLAHVAPGPHRRRGTGLPSRPGWRRRHRAVRSTWKWAS